jgi:hypothetical protein
MPTKPNNKNKNNKNSKSGKNRNGSGGNKSSGKSGFASIPAKNRMCVRLGKELAVRSTGLFLCSDKVDTGKAFTIGGRDNAAPDITAFPEGQLGLAASWANAVANGDKKLPAIDCKLRVYLALLLTMTPSVERMKTSANEEFGTNLPTTAKNANFWPAMVQQIAAARSDSYTVYEKTIINEVAAGVIGYWASTPNRK